MQKTLFLIFNILIIITFCTPVPKPKPKAQPKPKAFPKAQPNPLPKAEPKAKPNPKAKPQQFLLNGPIMWYESEPVGAGKVGAAQDIAERMRLQYHLKSVAQILQGLIASGKITTGKARELLGSFIETAVVGGAGTAKAEAAMMLAPCFPYNLCP